MDKKKNMPAPKRTYKGIIKEEVVIEKRITRSSLKAAAAAVAEEKPKCEKINESVSDKEDEDFDRNAPDSEQEEQVSEEESEESVEEEDSEDEDYVAPPKKKKTYSKK